HYFLLSRSSELAVLAPGRAGFARLRDNHGDSLEVCVLSKNNKYCQDSLSCLTSVRGQIPMNVSLTPELERLVNEKVESGLYQTASEVVREALRLLKERDHARERLRADVQAGFDDLARGEGRAYDKMSGRQLAERIKSRGRAARAKKS